VEHSFFQYLRVDRLPEDFIEEYLDWFIRLDDNEYILPPGTDRRILEHYLPKAEPFQTNESHKVRIRSKPVKYCDCTDRQELVNELVQALLEYEEQGRKLNFRLIASLLLGRSPEQKAFDKVKDGVEYFYVLRNERKLRKRDCPHAIKTIKKAIGIIEDVLNTVAKRGNQLGQDDLTPIDKYV
jgi:hypothetical protein